MFITRFTSMRIGVTYPNRKWYSVFKQKCKHIMCVGMGNS